MKKYLKECLFAILQTINWLASFMFYFQIVCFMAFYFVNRLYDYNNFIGNLLNYLNSENGAIFYIAFILIILIPREKTLKRLIFSNQNE